MRTGAGTSHQSGSGISSAHFADAYLVLLAFLENRASRSLGSQNPVSDHGRKSLIRFDLGLSLWRCRRHFDLAEAATTSTVHRLICQPVSIGVPLARHMMDGKPREARYQLPHLIEQWLEVRTLYFVRTLNLLHD